MYLSRQYINRLLAILSPTASPHVSFFVLLYAVNLSVQICFMTDVVTHPPPSPPRCLADFATQKDFHPFALYIVDVDFKYAWSGVAYLQKGWILNVSGALEFPEYIFSSSLSHATTEGGGGGRCVDSTKTRAHKCVRWPNTLLVQLCSCKSSVETVWIERHRVELLPVSTTIWSGIPWKKWPSPHPSLS